MYLAIDVGNTWVKIGVYDGRNLIDHSVYRKLTISRIHLLHRKYPITHSILCQSGVLSHEIIQSISSLSKLTILDHLTSLPIKIDYRTPETLGRDRIASAVGAYLYSNMKDNIIIINMGTCITMDVVDKNGVFCGGNISPGIYMRLKAMHQFTARLPMVEKYQNDEILGFDTTSALQNGGIDGANREIESFIDLVRINYAPYKVVLSGGDAYLFEKYTKKAIFVRPNIVMEGLIEIMIYNVQ